jgi:multiple sugar transport system permease protein
MKRRRAVMLNLLAIAASALFLFPLYWLVVNSLKTEIEIFANPPTWFPRNLVFTSYIEQMRSGDYNLPASFGNSCIISFCSMVLATILTVPAAYGIARYRLRGRRLMMLYLLVTQMLPATLILTPLFLIFKNLGIYNSYAAPVVANVAFFLPFGILMLRTYFLGIPSALEDAARIDGCNAFTTFIHVMVPISYPGIVVISSFSFLQAWGDLIFSLTFLNKQELRPLTAGLYNFIGQYGIEWSKVMAFGSIAVLPVVVVFVSLQRYLVAGLTNGAVKG